MRNRKWISAGIVILLLAVLYVSGPRPQSPEYNKTFPEIPEDPLALEEYLARIEDAHKLKPDNEARIVWSDSARNRTDYAVVYLHGFSASQMEGDPVHRRFAKEFGCNLLLARIADHGVDTTEALYYFTADRAWQSAKEALGIGERLGKKVILMSTSTGGTLALMLAAQYPEKVHALINLSPNIAINDPAAFILNDPWGLHIARMVLGGQSRQTSTTEEEAKYWNASYRIEALVQLQELVETSMTAETFHKIHQPSLTLYYYKNEEEQDPQVRVSAMLEMHGQLATPDTLKVAKAIPSAGAHVLGSSLTSRDVEGVYQEIQKFAVTTLGMTGLYAGSEQARPQAVSQSAPADR